MYQINLSELFAPKPRIREVGLHKPQTSKSDFLLYNAFCFYSCWNHKSEGNNSCLGQAYRGTTAQCHK